MAWSLSTPKALCGSLAGKARTWTLFELWWRFVKRQKHPNLPAPPREHDKVIILAPVQEFLLSGMRRYRLVEGTVHRGYGRVFAVRYPLEKPVDITYPATKKVIHGRYTVRRRDEGRTWARGWDTPAANALRTVVALADQPG